MTDSASLLQRARELGVERYPDLPSPIQDVMCSVYGVQERIRRRGRLGAARRRMEQIELLHHDRTAAEVLIERRLGRILEAARRTKASGDRAPRGDGGPSLNELERWPILTKRDIADDPDAFMSRRPEATDFSTLTSGTTGTPLTVWRPRETYRELFRASDTAKGWFGIRPDARRASFTGKQVVPLQSDRVWRLNLPGRQLALSQYHLGPRTVAAYERALRRWRPAILDGYTSNLVRLAQLLHDAGIRVPIPLIITTCEVLTQPGRELLRDVFGGAVCDKYGTSENAVLATECPAGNRHVFQNVGIIEAVRADGTPVSEGEPGRLLLTSLTNDLMPLVRYEVGDIGAILCAPVCPCGRSSPILSEILGREDDTVVLGDGREIGIFAFQLLRGMDDVLAMQVEQCSPTAFVVRAKLRRDDSEARTAFARAILSGFDRLIGDVDALSVRFEYPDRLDPTPGGKIRNVIRDF